MNDRLRGNRNKPNESSLRSESSLLLAFFCKPLYLEPTQQQQQHSLFSFSLYLHLNTSHLSVTDRTLYSSLESRVEIRELLLEWTERAVIIVQTRNVCIILVL